MANYFEKNFAVMGRVACITGSAAGLGLAIARHLGQAGARIVVNDLDAGRCEEAVRLLAAEGIEARHAVFDVSRAEAVGEAIDRLAVDGWATDILVSNAGNQNRKTVTEMTLAQWQSLFDVHVNGAFNCAHAVLPHLPHGYTWHGPFLVWDAPVPTREGPYLGSFHFKRRAHSGRPATAPPKGDLRAARALAHSILRRLAPE